MKNEKNNIYKFYFLTCEKIFKILDSSIEGLNSLEANKRFLKYGKNEFKFYKKNNFLLKLKHQFNDIMIWLLLIVSFISLIFIKDFINFIVILLVLFLNAFFGIIQEIKSENITKTLNKFTDIIVNVFRNKKIIKIKSKFLVPGDIVYIKTGDIVPADIRLIKSDFLRVEESHLTGETISVFKNSNIFKKKSNIKITDCNNIIFLNSNVVSGNAIGIVIFTGKNTIIGKIAKKLVNNNDIDKTVLKKKINIFAKKLTFIILFISFLIFIIGILNKQNFIYMLLVSISLSVAAIPEGLPAIITIILSLGTQNLSKNNVLIKKLSSVETLGSIDVICTDKTGTLTYNKMKINEIYINNKIIKFKQNYKYIYNNNNINILLKILCLNNDIILDNNNFFGDSLEISLLKFVKKINNIYFDKYFNKIKKIKMIPFDSYNKYMIVFNEEIINNKKKYFISIKGAIEKILKMCSYLFINNKIILLNNFYKKKIIKFNKIMVEKELRVLAFAYKIVEYNIEKIIKNNINNLIFVGFIGMYDCERKDSKLAIKIAKLLNIIPIMITGDHYGTAKSIAEKIGIIKKNKKNLIINCEKNNDLLFKKNIEKNGNNIFVYSRVLAKNKVDIIKMWQKKGKIVAMIGDGVNDTLALKQANVGIGMGSGTEITKNISDILLLDDKFYTIILGIKEGRKIFINIKKVICYLLSANLCEIIITFISILFKLNILLPIHLLWINFVTDTLPAIILGISDVEDKFIMNINFNKLKNDFLNKIDLFNIFIQGIIQSILIFLIYLILYKNFNNINNNITIIFVSLGLIQLFHSFNIKNNNPILYKKIFDNKLFNIIILISFFLLILPILFIPLNKIFSVTLLKIHQWFFIILISFLIIPIIDILKIFEKKYNKKL